jgi:hypothetical protein
MIDHACLVEDDRRLRTDVDAPSVRAGGESVERQRIPLERRTVSAKPLSCRTGDCDPDCFAACQLLRSCRGVDDDTLTCARWPDKHARTLGTSQDEQRHVLLVSERSPDALCDFARRVYPCGVADIASGGPGEYCCSSFDCLLLRADRERRHPAALQCQHASILDHLPRYLECFVWRQFSGGLLQGDGVQVAQLEDGVSVGEAFLDPILDWSDGWLGALAGE